jgi:hypothetical protein
VRAASRFIPERSGGFSIAFLVWAIKLKSALAAGWSCDQLAPPGNAVFQAGLFL